MERLVADGFDVNARNRWGRTPLFIGAFNYNTDVAEFLIAEGADVNAKCKSWWMQGWWWKHRSWIVREFGWTPLHAAIDRERLGVAELLLANGADTNAKDENDFTPLHLACNAELAQLLIAKCADVNARDKNGETPLHKMVGREDVAELLISNGADVNAKDKDGMSVLDCSVMTDLVELLIAKGADHTVHSTAYMGELTNLKALIEKGADVNGRDKFGQTALHLAAFAGHKTLVELLLANGARVDDMEGEIRLTPLEMAALTDHQEVAELLITNGADITVGQPLLYAINNGHKQLVEFLLKNGADVNSMSRRLPKSWSFRLSSEDNGRGVWIFIPVTTPTSGTSIGPIPRALAEQLVFKGLDAETGYGWLISPLWVAKCTENVEISELLQEYGALELSLHQAAAEGDIGQVQLHILQGTDLNATHRRRTPLSYARDNGHTEIVELLRKHGAKE